MHDVIIIGAGIAGLAAAYELQQRGLAPLIVEERSRAGGVIVTERVDGYVIDGGPDSLLVQKPAALALCNELGIADRLIPTLPPRTAYVLRGGQLLALPEGSFLGLPTRLQPLITAKLFSWPAKARMAAELAIAVERDAPDESIGSFMRRRFGQEAVDYLGDPLLAGIHAGDVNALSIHALFPRFVELERTHGSVLRALFALQTQRRGGSAFVSFPDGIDVLTETLVERLGPGTIRSGATVAEVAGTGPYVLTLSGGESFTSRAIIAAIPAWRAATALRAVDAELAALCDSIPYTSSATVALAVRREQVAHPMAGTGFVVPRRERRSLMAGTWVTAKWPHRAPDGQVLLRGFLGGAHDPQVLDKSDAELIALAWSDLADVLGMSGSPHLTRVFRWPRASAQYNVGHLATVRAIDARLGALPGLYVTGSAYRGTGIPDCVADARATATAAATFLR
ncbi:MAG TPA: protoporphyrinogen oxidase [Vicinamibacterales bacterium]|nr:protoporphyrinogen oxidase [Vicinamibacterales bacterium]